MRRILSSGALGEGSGWDLRVRPASPEAASGNLGMFHDKCFTANIHDKMIKANVHTKRHQVILAKALDGIWQLVMSVQCCAEAPAGQMT